MQSLDEGSNLTHALTEHDVLEGRVQQVRPARIPRPGFGGPPGSPSLTIPRFAITNH
jgi:hypothetical protein